MVSINGQYAGLGIDPVTGVADQGDTVASVIDYVRRMYTPARTNVPPGRVFTRALETEIRREQQAFVDQGKLKLTDFIPGIVDLDWKYASGYLKKPPAGPKVWHGPVVFTVEGHMSNMWVGPSASIGATMQAEGRAFWQPVGYDCLSLPFKNEDGVRQLYALLSGNALVNADTGQVLADFSPGTPWTITGFSQGAMVVSQFMKQHVIPESGALHYRLKDFVWGYCFGNPNRGRNAMVPWNDNPPAVDTSGIMLDELFDAVALGIGDRWGETANVGDMFADCTNDAAGQDKAAIAKIVTRNSWTGGPVALTARVLSIFKDLPAGAFNAIRATVSAIIFLAKNPNPHYGTIAEPGDLQSFRIKLPVVQ